MTLFGALLTLLRRELQLSLRQRSDVLTAMLFFVVVVSLFPLGVGADPVLLLRIAPGVLWVAALLASLLGLHRLFVDDWNDGTLEQLALTPWPLAWLVLAKVIGHWLACGLPLVLLAPLLGLQFGLPLSALPVLLLSLLLGTPLLSLVGAIGAALTLGMRGSGALLALLVLPLFVPTLIFGAGAVSASLTGLDPYAHLQLLAGLLLAGVVLAPLACASAIRISLE